MKDFSEITVKDIRSLKQTGEELFNVLFSINRSLTGKGVEDTFNKLQDIAQFDILKFYSGDKFWGWTVPDEWNVRNAYVKELNGKKVIDFKNNNLHLVGYSRPIDIVLSYEELNKHLFTLPNMPDAIPYRTTYYNNSWGFCLSFKDFSNLDKKKKYHVKIECDLSPGELLMGEKKIRGKEKSEYILSTYSCHPSMANDNLSGIILWVLLLKLMQEHSCKKSYRFIIGPETLGAIAYLHLKMDEMKKIKGGYVITTVAGPGKLSYKRSFSPNSVIDRAAESALNQLEPEAVFYPFNLKGSDERSFSAPAFRIPTGTIAKSKYYEYSYYHTSLDNLDFVSSDDLIRTLEVYVKAIQNIEIIEDDFIYKSNIPFCEPHLGGYGLYPLVGGAINPKIHQDTPVITHDDLDAIKWLFFYGDGTHSLTEVARKTEIKLNKLHELFLVLKQKSLVSIVE